MEDRITPQSRPNGIHITALYELDLRKSFKKLDTILNMKLADINSKLHGRKGVWDIIERVIGVLFYPQPGSEY